MGASTREQSEGITSCQGCTGAASELGAAGTLLGHTSPAKDSEVSPHPQPFSHYFQERNTSNRSRLMEIKEKWCSQALEIFKSELFHSYFSQLSLMRNRHCLTGKVFPSPVGVSIRDLFIHRPVLAITRYKEIYSP